MPEPQVLVRHSPILDEASFHSAMLNFISPTFESKKLESPSYNDLLDVFEDRMRNWFFLPISKLLEVPHGDIAAVSILFNYFEGIEIYLSGKDSKSRSAEFFRRGFEKVFTIDDHGVALSAKIASAIYEQGRCGFAHDGMFRDRVFFTRLLTVPFLITWPQVNGVFNPVGKVESILINPLKAYDSIEKHFDGYMKKLRSGSDESYKQHFQEAVDLKWGLNEPDRAIGMTETEFVEFIQSKVGDLKGNP